MKSVDEKKNTAMMMTAPVLDPNFYEGGESVCAPCGQTTQQMRRHAPDNAAASTASMHCFTCRTVTLHRVTWDGVAFSHRGERQRTASVSAHTQTVGERS